MPTGVALRDAREQMFAAAERILLREGPHALTSRAVTAEAGVAKGVLHRHFADFDAFLAELVEDRIARIGAQAAALHESAGTGTVAGNLTAEQGLGRIAADADVGTLAPTLLGASHLLFADRAGAAPEPEAVRKVVTTVIAGVVRDEIPRP